MLKAGVMVKGKHVETNIGTPQGENLSLLLSNIMLNEMVKELKAKGLHFARYADDCVIVVESSAAANRVMNTITKGIERKLELKVNDRVSSLLVDTRKNVSVFMPFLVL